MTLFTRHGLVAALAVPLHYASVFYLPHTRLLEDPVTTLTVACPVLFAGHAMLILMSLAMARSMNVAVSVLIQALLGIVIAAGVLHVTIVLFGAPLFEKSYATFCFASYLAMLTIMPTFAALGSVPWSTWIKVFLQHSPTTTAEIYAYTQAICALSGAWIGAIVLPLDWDRDWQRWPISCVISTFLGHFVGVVAAVAWATFKSIFGKKKNE